MFNLPSESMLVATGKMQSFKRNTIWIWGKVIYSKYNLPETSSFISAQMAVQSSSFLVFIVLGMYNFEFGGEKFIPCHVPRDEMSSESLHAFGWHFTMVNFYRTVSGEFQSQKVFSQNYSKTKWSNGLKCHQKIKPKECLISPWGQFLERVLLKHKCQRHECLCKTLSQNYCTHGEIAFSNSTCICNVIMHYSVSLCKEKKEHKKKSSNCMPTMGEWYIMI